MKIGETNEKLGIKEKVRQAVSDNIVRVNELMAVLARKNKTLTELAELTDIPVSTLYLRTSHKQPFKYNELVAIKTALELNEAEFCAIFPF